MSANQATGSYNDIRDIIFSGTDNYLVTAAVTAERDGILAGMEKAVQAARELGLEIVYSCRDGLDIFGGEKVLLVRGGPKQLAMAEELLIGLLAKSSGIATAAANAVRLAGRRPAVVSGAWKKMPPEIKLLVREATVIGGAGTRICNQPFLYLDKNYVRIFGGVAEALLAVHGIVGMLKVIQLKGETVDITDEAETAVIGGANILMIDTGNSEDVDVVSQRLKEKGLRDKVKIAFAGGVRLEDIPGLKKKDIDILDIGTAIVDAPLLDFRLDVIEVRRGVEDSFRQIELNLLEKTELWVEDIRLDEVDLNKVAAVVAGVLDLDRAEVMVVDVRENSITLDILRRTVPAEMIIDREREILNRLAELPGICLGKNASIHSEGILGMIAMSPEEAKETLMRSREMAAEIRRRVAKRVKVFPSGFEVKQGMIKDKNSPLIVQRLEAGGYQVAVGHVLEDDREMIAADLLRAVDEGYGLVITTGGVGAEDKDHTVEAILSLDKDAVTPFIVRFKKGLGRHMKEGVRIAVGQVGNTLIIALPGPNEEVRAVLDAITPLLAENPGKHYLAEKIASILRDMLARKKQGSADRCLHENSY